MALTVTNKGDSGATMPLQVYGSNLKAVALEIDFDSSYATGGESLDLTSGSNKYFNEVFMVLIENKSGYMFEYDYSTKKVKVFTPSISHSHKAFTVNATETAADKTAFVSITEGDGTAQSGIAVAHAGGAGSDIDINTDSVSAAAGSEVANATDLSALVNVRVLAFGY